MYEERLGTDWTDISDDEAIDRAFALGVAAAFGHEDRVEFDRLRTALDTAYDRSIIDLAYEEGRGKAEGLRRDADSETDIWEHLVGVSDGRPTDRGGDPDTGSEDGPGPAGGRPSLLDRAGLLEGGEEMGALGRPPLLDPTDREDDE
ncbi:hypothetical protein [Candidatus Halobonum tyrrellensis]|uniref:Uncharacterized protein n=1 Tax=Candidatus Halobonum tyrrellensis G22 TaxID=1324957 RepID=V4GWM6_9EURY|nr:hypothetical protein [Candidatus Halobonum tyrrellensis]ESP89571.1 hypothetical protein K933_03405 [Candidatus Halobonum tyrrellensis G22]